jgi:hypothetical protein
MLLHGVAELRDKGPKLGMIRREIHSRLYEIDGCFTLGENRHLGSFAVLNLGKLNATFEERNAKIA